MVVTGGSRGIGAATARLAASRGYAVCISFVRNREAADAVITDIRRSGGQAIAVAAGVSSERDVTRLFAAVDEELGPVTALVDNAGVLERQMRVVDMSAERLTRTFATDVIGCFLCAREAVRRNSTRRGGAGGAIVNVSSAASRLGSAGEYVDYAASKGAIDTMTIGLAQEVAAEGIRVNAVRPAFIYTDIHAAGGGPNRVERVKEFVPMKRGGHPEEVARAILWLLSRRPRIRPGRSSTSQAASSCRTSARSRRGRESTACEDAEAPSGLIPGVRPSTQGEGPMRPVARLALGLCPGSVAGALVASVIRARSCC